MFRRGVALALSGAALAVAGCGGGERQDADEPRGEFRLDVVSAKFPAAQSIAESTTFEMQVRNAGDRTVPNLAVTVETKAPREGEAPIAFGTNVQAPELADSARPVWILDRDPSGGETAYTNTWAFGRLRTGQTKTFRWSVTAVRPGDYTVEYRVAPGLDGRARNASGTTVTGSLDVTIADEPVPARVDGDGNVVRGEEAKR